MTLSNRLLQSGWWFYFEAIYIQDKFFRASRLSSPSCIYEIGCFKDLLSFKSLVKNVLNKVVEV